MYIYIHTKSNIQIYVSYEHEKCDHLWIRYLRLKNRNNISAVQFIHTFLYVALTRIPVSPGPNY